MIGGTGTGTGTGKSRGDFTATSAQLENVVHITTSVIMHSDSNFELADSSAFMGNLKEEGTVTLLYSTLNRPDTYTYDDC